jgi:predicted nucleic acid-binding protein
MLLPEVSNAIWRNSAQTQEAFRDPTTLAVATRRLTLFKELEFYLTEPPNLYELAYELANRFGRPLAYDMQYVALATIAGCVLWTADQRLLNALGGHLRYVRPLDTYQP